MQPNINQQQSAAPSSAENWLSSTNVEEKMVQSTGPQVKGRARLLSTLRTQNTGVYADSHQQ